MSEVCVERAHAEFAVSGDTVSVPIWVASKEGHGSLESGRDILVPPIFGATALSVSGLIRHICEQTGNRTIGYLQPYRGIKDFRRDIIDYYARTGEAVLEEAHQSRDDGYDALGLSLGALNIASLRSGSARSDALTMHNIGLVQPMGADAAVVHPEGDLRELLFMDLAPRVLAATELEHASKARLRLLRKFGENAMKEMIRMIGEPRELVASMRGNASEIVRNGTRLPDAFMVGATAPIATELAQAISDGSRVAVVQPGNCPIYSVEDAKETFPIDEVVTSFDVAPGEHGHVWPTTKPGMKMVDIALRRISTT